TQDLRDAIIRIGSENLLWGYKRIVGELKKLGLYAGANSVKRVLNEAGNRRQHWLAIPPVTWCATASCRVDLFRHALGGNLVKAATIALERRLFAGKFLPAFYD